MKTEKAIFAAGCFWGVQAVFDKLSGVASTRVGYTGGHTKNPSYEDVCGRGTGHAEAVEVTFDPKRIEYEALLAAFFACHDPTTRDGQGPDVGSQYRSAIFYLDEKQKKAAESAKNLLGESHAYNRPIVTEITPATEFFEAEAYHQKYYASHPNTCR